MCADLTAGRPQGPWDPDEKKKYVDTNWIPGKAHAEWIAERQAEEKAAAAAAKKGGGAAKPKP